MELVTQYFGRVPKSDRVRCRATSREKPPQTKERRVTVNESVAAAGRHRRVSRSPTTATPIRTRCT